MTNVTFGFLYHFYDNSTTVYEEYLIYDAISMVGSVGGTLGMCIGFSFTGIISFLINILQQGIFIIKPKLSNEKNEISYNRSKSTEIFSGGSLVQYVKEMEGSVYLKSETVPQRQANNRRKAECNPYGTQCILFLLTFRAFSRARRAKRAEPFQKCHSSIGLEMLIILKKN